MEEVISKFDDIRPYTDEESQKVYQMLAKHPSMIQLMRTVYPDYSEQEVTEELRSYKRVDDFQRKFAYPGIRQIIARTSDGVSFSGFDKLEKGKAYLFISNHRDIILDTTLLNMLLIEHGHLLTESAIGNNLVQRDFLHTVAKLNRNFIVKRDLPVRQMLEHSLTLSEYIHHVVCDKNRSVWIAQREGRTKDGNDQTHSGVLKMIGMASGDKLIEGLKELRIVPMSVSYEWDPTDGMKMTELMAKANNEEYVKGRNEDYRSIMTGLQGQKGRIHIALSAPLDEELDELKKLSNVNKQIRGVGEIIDRNIHANYKLWPSNYMAYDQLHKTDKYSDKYTEEDLVKFKRRLKKRLGKFDDQLAVSKFLKMYATPVMNHPDYV